MSNYLTIAAFSGLNRKTGPKYKPRKPGLYDQKIAAERTLRHLATMKARQACKADTMKALYGSRRLSTGTMREHFEWAQAEFEAKCQGFRLRHTEHGDFSHLTPAGLL